MTGGRQYVGLQRRAVDSVVSLPVIHLFNNTTYTALGQAQRN